jgi:hypothetical protein
MPNEFIPVLEDSGQIVEVGKWVLRTAIAQVRRWMDQGYSLVISVNASARQFGWRWCRRRGTGSGVRATGARFVERTESYRRDLRRIEYGDERDPEMRRFQESIGPLNNAAKIKSARRPMPIPVLHGRPFLEYLPGQTMRNHPS